MATLPNSGRAADADPVTRSKRVLSSSTESVRPSRGISRSEILNTACRGIAQAKDAQSIQSTLDEMIARLRVVRLGVDARQWADWVGACRRHPLLELLHEDPFTRRAFEKPRGYAGDAVLLDYIYGVEELWPRPTTSNLGGLIFDYTTRSPAPNGVRARRAYIAREIDKHADSMRHPDVLSVAAGHFREALLCQAIKRRLLGRTVALDADTRSLEVVEAEYGRYGVETQPINIRALLTGRGDIGQFDLVYSMGLFDYLGDSVSRRLVKRLFEALKPGGKLIVANFLPGIEDIGYMEAFMDWTLVYRTRREMIEMTMEIEQQDLQGIRIAAEENQNIIFLEIVRK